MTFVLTLSSLMTLLGVAIGALVAARAPAGTRREHLWAWTRSQWSMQKPWLLPVAGCVVLMPATYFVHAIGSEWLERAVSGSQWLAVLLWLVLTVRFANDWSRSFRESAESLRLGPSSARSVMVILGWATYVVAMLDGASCGILVILWSRQILA